MLFEHIVHTIYCIGTNDTNTVSSQEYQNITFLVKLYTLGGLRLGRDCRREILYVNDTQILITHK